MPEPEPEPEGLPPGVSLEKLLDAVESEMFGLENPGFCMSCGHQQDGCEPDAREYECEECEENQVFGAEWIMIGVVA